VKLVHLFGFITKKFVTMHGHLNVKVKSKLGVVSRKSQAPGSRLDVQQVSSLDRQ
jgi:hypothetical protein